MGKKEILRLMAGFRKFREKYFANEHPLYQRLSSSMGQAPKTLIIGCSDSRVDPAIITSASPGELFIVRNVANLVPPYERGGVHGVSAAIEFAIVNLKVENVIVLGHRQCGGIRALMTHNQQPASTDSFVENWVSIAKDAKKRVLEKHGHETEDNLCRHAELESIVTSLNNLRTFPFVEAAIKERDLALMGIYFDLEQGHLLEYDEKNDGFKNIEV